MGIVRQATDMTGLTRPKESEQHVRNLRSLAEAFASYQGENEAARMAAMQNQLKTLEPMRAQYERMYGAGTAPQISQFAQSPYPQGRSSLDQIFRGLGSTGKKKAGDSSWFGGIPILGDIESVFKDVFGLGDDED